MADTKKNLPAMPFYWGDWFKALDVQSIPKDIRCTWFEMLGRMWESKRRGYLCVNGQPLDDLELSTLLGFGRDILECKKHINHLEKRDIFSRTKEGIIYCRRMVKDAKSSKIKSNSGKKGMEIRYNRNVTPTITEREDENEDENSIKEKDMITPLEASQATEKVFGKSEEPEAITPRKIQNRLITFMKKQWSSQCADKYQITGRDRKAISELRHNHSPDVIEYRILFAFGLKEKIFGLQKNPITFAILQSQWNHLSNEIGKYQCPGCGGNDHFSKTADYCPVYQKAKTNGARVTVEQDISNLQEAGEWENILLGLKEKTSEDNFQTWLRPIQCRVDSEKSRVLYVPSKYHKDWIQSHFMEDIKSEFFKINPGVAVRVCVLRVS